MISDHQTESRLIKEEKELGEDRMKQTTVPHHLQYIQIGDGRKLSLFDSKLTSRVETT